MFDLPTNDLFNLDTKKRFFSFVASFQAGECWIWDGSVISSGYGQFWYNGKMYLAHRFSYMMFYGHIPDNKLVCHKCDTKRCISPYHLYVGTYSENLQDKYDRDPNSHRRIFNFSKVNEADATAMKILRSGGATYEDISKSFNVTRQTISNIVNDRTSNFKE